MPRVFKMGPYLVYFWSDEREPLEPVHAHISIGEPVKDATKIWLTKSGGVLLENNNSRIPTHTLRNIMDAIEAQHAMVCMRWLKLPETVLQAKVDFAALGKEVVREAGAEVFARWVASVDAQSKRSAEGLGDNVPVLISPNVDCAALNEGRFVFSGDWAVAILKGGAARVIRDGTKERSSGRLPRGVRYLAP